MKKEKAKYVKLPDGAEFRRVEVTVDGRIKIIYAEECVNKKETIINISIPKPIPLIGGSKVYQKDDGLPYWYCRIKEERDEFMHLYFEDLTEDDLLFDANGNEHKFKTDSQKEFKANVLKALKIKPEEGYRWIPVLEPSKDLKGNIQYVEGENVLRKLSSYEWKKEMKKYSPKNGSKIASITTYFLLLLRWLKDGVATLEQLADDSKEIGHYWDSKNSKHEFEETGEREFGGLFGFTGNTYKIVEDQDTNSGFSIVGGNYISSGSSSPLSKVVPDNDPSYSNYYGVGLMELIK